MDRPQRFKGFQLDEVPVHSGRCQQLLLRPSVSFQHLRRDVMTSLIWTVQSSELGIATATKGIITFFQSHGALVNVDHVIAAASSDA